MISVFKGPLVLFQPQQKYLNNSFKKNNKLFKNKQIFVCKSF